MRDDFLDLRLCTQYAHLSDFLRPFYPYGITCIVFKWTDAYTHTGWQNLRCLARYCQKSRKASLRVVICFSRQKKSGPGQLGERYNHSLTLLRHYTTSKSFHPEKWKILMFLNAAFLQGWCTLRQRDARKRWQPTWTFGKWCFWWQTKGRQRCICCIQAIQTVRRRPCEAHTYRSRWSNGRTWYHERQHHCCCLQIRASQCAMACSEYLAWTRLGWRAEDVSHQLQRSGVMAAGCKQWEECCREPFEPFHLRVCDLQFQHVSTCFSMFQHVSTILGTDILSHSDSAFFTLPITQGASYRSFAWWALEHERTETLQTWP